MTCPTCASPLPAGAMFCGECGRAVTSADVAAQRSAEAARGARPDQGAPASGVVPPPWQQRPPQHVPAPGAEPWWVRERAGDDAAPGPQDHRPEVAAAPSAQADRDPAAPTTGDLSSWPPPVVPERPEEREQRPEARRADGAPARRAAEPRGTADRGASPRDPGPSTRVPEPAPPAALREPSPVVDASPRPTSAPLWTASLAPLPTDPTAPAEDGPGAPDGADGDPSTAAGAAAPQPRGTAARAELPERQGRHAGPSPAGPGDDAGRGDDPDRPDGPDGPGRPSADDRADPSHRARPDEGVDRPGVAAGAAPTPGDTARVERLLPDVAPAPVVPGVGHDPAPSTSDLGSSRTPASSDAEEGTAPDATPGEQRDDAGTGPEVHRGSDAGPVPLVEPGAQAERCTQCGALVHEDDIFCGECGAVVQSVARSFTGPIVPIAPSWQPPVAEEHAAAAEPTPGPSAPQRSADLGGSEDAGEAERRRLVDQAARRALDWPPAASSRDEDGARRADDRTGADGRPGDAGRGGADPAGAPAVPPSVRPAPLVQPPVTGVPDAVRGALPDGPDRPDDQGRSVDRPSPPLLPPVPPSVTTPSWASPARPTGDDDDVDETRIVRRRPVGDEFTLQFSTGESVRVSGHGLLGRAPVAQPGESFEHLVRISDPGKSVSKTHLEFGQEAGHLWVSDRWSGNGTLVRPSDGPARRVQPGTRVRVERGTRVDIGEQFFLVG